MAVSQKTTTENKAKAARTGSSLRLLTEAVRPIVKQILPQKSMIFQQIFDFWPEIVATTEAAGSIPEKLTFQRQQQNNGCLSVWARTGAQATEMSYNRTALIRRINSVFGYALVAEVKVTAFPGLGLPAAKKATPAKVKVAQGIPSQSLDKILGGISNPSLRQILSELGGLIDQPNPENDTNP